METHAHGAGDSGHAVLARLAGTTSLVRALFDGSREGLVLLDREYTIQAINRAMLILIDKDEPEVLGSSLSAITSGTTTETHLHALQGMAKAAFEKHTVQGWTPFSVRNPQGTPPRHLELMTSPILGLHDAVEYVLGAVCDVTDSKALRERLEEAHQRDELTHLYNRKAFHTIFPQEVLRAKRQRYPLTLLVLDIDFFKDLCDKKGAQAADLHLQETATLLLSSTRQGVDTAYRFEGDDFALILPGTEVSQARVIAQRIVRAYEAKGTGTTLSIGIREMIPQDTADEILLIAKEELYRAKKSGGNTICG